MPTNDIGQDRFQARLTKELKIKGSMPAPVLAPEIVPVLLVEGERPENLHIQREHRFAVSLTLGAVAGEYMYFQVWNPAGRDGLIVIEEVALSKPAAIIQFDWGVADVAVKASLGARDTYSLDTRLPGPNPGRGVGEALVGTDAGMGFLDVCGRCHAPSNDMGVVRPNMVLSPGYGFGIQNLWVNEAVAGWCMWRERQATDGELSGP